MKTAHLFNMRKVYYALLGLVLIVSLGHLVVIENTRVVGLILLASMVMFVGLVVGLMRLLRPKKLWIRGLVAVLFGALGIGIMVLSFVGDIAGRFLFMPYFDEESYEIVRQQEQFEELIIEGDDLTLSGWMLHQTEGKGPVVIYYCGNAENAARRMRFWEEDQLPEVFKGYNVVMVDYPGYGKSSGTPSEASLKQMGLMVYDAIAERQDVDAEQIVVGGYSIGTGVANYVASMRQPKGLFLMAPYASGYDLHNHFLNIFHGPFKELVQYKMEASQFAENIEVRPLVIASLADQIVAYESSAKLSKAYPMSCDFQTMEELTHDAFWYDERVHQLLSDYLQELAEAM